MKAVAKFKPIFSTECFGVFRLCLVEFVDVFAKAKIVSLPLLPFCKAPGVGGSLRTGFGTS